ncbi:MAG: hypothetical protein OET44_14265 [Gammaproteobacteria bacterium]|nr:hypothetical protein [Gammaproteobacteria bacterium]
MTKHCIKPYQSPAVVSSLGLACLGLLAGCGGASGGDNGGGGGGTTTGPLAVTSGNAQTLAKAALTVAVIGESLLSSSGHYGVNTGGPAPCDSGVLTVTPTGSGSTDTITTPSGNVISPPATSDTVVDYTDCLEDGYTKSGREAVGSTGGGSRVRWMNVGLEHLLIDDSSVVGAAIYTIAGDIVYRIDDLTVTQGSSSFYAVGQIDTFSFSRQLRFDVQLRFPNGSAQVTAPQRLTGVRGEHFDGGEMLIEGAASSVTVVPQGGGFYRLEIDENGDDIADAIVDAVAL